MADYSLLEHKACRAVISGSGFEDEVIPYLIDAWLGEYAEPSNKGRVVAKHEVDV